MKNNEQKRSAVDQLHCSTKRTAGCKYRAANRLRSFQNLSKIIIAVSSLSLIFIPLWGIAYGDKTYHSVSDSFLDFYQIFLAIVMLTFSSIISTASYDLRIYKLEQCGFELRSFTKKLRMNMDSEDRIEQNKFEELQNEYEEILKNSLEHTESDYVTVLFEEDCSKKISNYFFKRYFTLHYIAVLWIFFMIFFEIIVILDVVGWFHVCNFKVLC